MATISPPPPLAAAPDRLAAFRAALPPGTGHSAVADRLCALGVTARLERGQELPPDLLEDRLVWIVSGAAKLVVPQTSSAAAASGVSGSQVLAFHFAGDLVSVLRRRDADFRLIGLGDCELVIFPAEDFLDIAQGQPAVLRSVLSRSLQALHRSRTRMMQMGHKSAGARLADFLVSMAERLADCCEGACTFTLPMSRRDIGDSLGLTIETVSRQLTELREAGLVETEGRSKVRLSDIAALAKLAGKA